MIDNKLLLAVAAAASLTAIPAAAADLYAAPPPRVVPAPIEVAGGWYLRGDVGVGIQDFRNVTLNPDYPTYGVVDRFHNSPTIVGLGVGYQFNEWLRLDVTGEYRGNSTFGYLLNSGGSNGAFNNYTGHIESFLGMVNAYADLGNFYGLTPFVGVGVGFGSHSVSGFQDNGLIASGGGFGYQYGSRSDTQFAWALHAGVSYAINESLKLELSYRYLDMGSVVAGSINCQGPFGCGSPVTYTLRDLTSQDIRIGMRWAFGAPPAPVPAPIRPVIARN